MQCIGCEVVASPVTNNSAFEMQQQRSPTTELVSVVDDIDQSVSYSDKMFP